MEKLSRAFAIFRVVFSAPPHPTAVWIIKASYFFIWLIGGNPRFKES